MKRRIDTNLPFFEEILMRARDCRRNGSAALDLCYVAAGRHDLYWEPNLKAWDIAAGALMVQEAGGLFTDMHGAPLTCKSAQSENDKFSVFGSNGHLHSIVLHHFEEVRKRENK
jgi:myo-inositol-1(or 4)-monophosphatase